MPVLYYRGFSPGRQGAARCASGDGPQSQIVRTSEATLVGQGVNYPWPARPWQRA